jgi:hypothetical protein
MSFSRVQRFPQAGMQTENPSSTMNLHCNKLGRQRHRLCIKGSSVAGGEASLSVTSGTRGSPVSVENDGPRDPSRCHAAKWRNSYRNLYGFAAEPCKLMWKGSRWLGVRPGIARSCRAERTPAIASRRLTGAPRFRPARLRWRPR